VQNDTIKGCIRFECTPSVLCENILKILSVCITLYYLANSTKIKAIIAGKAWVKNIFLDAVKAP
jgi:hypothetical protein